MMSPLQNFAVVISLVDSLRDRGSWCGETHIQKAVYLLEEAKNVPLNFDFVLYKHGPYSFELKDQLDQMKSMRIIKVVPQQYPYGPRIEEDNSAGTLKRMYAKTLRNYKSSVERVAEFINSKGVAELEKLATAVYVIKEAENVSDVAELADRLCEYKPHVSKIMAEQAIVHVREFLGEKEVG